MTNITRHTLIFIICIFTSLLVSAGALAQDLSGRWQGTLVAAQYDPIDVVFNLHKEQGDATIGPDGTTATGTPYTGTLDIPSQFRTGLPIDSISIRDQQITIRLGSIQVEYYGSLIVADNGDVIAIEGDWNQSGEYVPLRLEASPRSAQDATGP